MDRLCRSLAVWERQSIFLQHSRPLPAKTTGMAPGACERDAAHTASAAPMVNYPKAQPSKGNAGVHASGACGQLDSKQCSPSAELTAPFLETRSPAAPRGLQAARRAIASRVNCPNVICHEGGDMGHNLLWKLHRSLLSSRSKKRFNFGYWSLCPCCRVQMPNGQAGVAVNGYPYTQVSKLLEG